ncbi:RNA polymerase sigma-70 factor (ECF subfamily) [Chitinophaga skermanii]|uniref:RNA polymerase sigma-70 factor (ECF subfamily) n=1 Tax=Chitinophaga skermanii TaxID=331697 RepID=A0A327QVE6_9BACT|nr:RNA polymerase sigma-70 factor [Chitinophaga skermanii]RAJ08291.1 RNA polymerase sigma-70 factor (ECF subfamily) [Chitinophaga skermanii]
MHAPQDHITTEVTEAIFTAAYQSYGLQLLRTSFHVLQDEHAAQEVVQDVFTSLWQNRTTRRIEGNIEHYLVRAVRLKSFQYLRDKLSHAAHEANYAQCAMQCEAGTENTVLYRNLSECIQKAVCKMPQQCREVFTLKREAGLMNREIAAKLEVSEKTVENHITRAHKFLKSQLSSLFMVFFQIFLLSR